MRGLRSGRREETPESGSNEPIIPRGELDERFQRFATRDFVHEEVGKLRCKWHGTDRQVHRLYGQLKAAASLCGGLVLLGGVCGTVAIAISRCSGS